MEIEMELELEIEIEIELEIEMEIELEMGIGIEIRDRDRYRDGDRPSIYLSICPSVDLAEQVAVLDESHQLALVHRERRHVGVVVLEGSK